MHAIDTYVVANSCVQQQHGRVRAKHIVLVRWRVVILIWCLLQSAWRNSSGFSSKNSSGDRALPNTTDNSDRLFCSYAEPSASSPRTPPGYRDRILSLVATTTNSLISTTVRRKTAVRLVSFYERLSTTKRWVCVRFGALGRRHPAKS